jgi:protein AATF/BFR2
MNEYDDQLANMIDDNSLSALESQLSVLQQQDAQIFKKEKAAKPADDQKAMHVSTQNRLYQNVLLSRMRLQQPLTLMQSLPPSDMLPEFSKYAVDAQGKVLEKGDKVMAVEESASHPMHKKLCIASAVTAQALGDLIELERLMGGMDGTTSASQAHTVPFEKPHLLTGLTAKAKAKYNQDGEDKPAKRRKTNTDKDLDAIEAYLAESWEQGTASRNKIMDKWFKRVQVATGKSEMGQGVNLTSLNQPLSVQIQHILDIEGDRFVQRSRLRRVTTRSLGVPKLDFSNMGAGDDVGNDLELMQQKQRESRFDGEIYDDNDLYSGLLKELSAQALEGDGMSGLADSIRAHEANLKKHTKLAKNVDLRASKGRKIRFEVLPKVANFMVPIVSPQWIAACATSGGALSKTDALLGVASGQEMLVDELLQGLFGQQERQEKGSHGVAPAEADDEEKEADYDDDMDEDGDFEELNPDEDDDNAAEKSAEEEFDDGGDFTWFKQ